MSYTREECILEASEANQDASGCQKLTGEDKANCVNELQPLMTPDKVLEIDSQIQILQDELKKGSDANLQKQLRADDAAGLIIAKELKAYIKDKKKRKQLKVFLGETAPENLTGQIKKFKPTHLIVIDAVDFNLETGALRVVDIRTEAGVSFSTHRAPNADPEIW